MIVCIIQFKKRSNGLSVRAQDLTGLPLITGGEERNGGAFDNDRPVRSAAHVCSFPLSLLQLLHGTTFLELIDSGSICMHKSHLINLDHSVKYIKVKGGC